MRTIQVEDDVYQYLLQRAQEIGEQATPILRRELGLPRPNGSDQSSFVSPGATPRNGTHDGELLALVANPTFQRHGSVKEKYLEILSFLAKKHGQDFDRVLTIGGRHRTYFASSSEEIRKSGTSTQPRPIPGTNFWALTNAATRHKRQILWRVLAALGYSTPTLHEVTRAVTKWD
jgi:negative modulator of initiation of replication